MNWLEVLGPVIVQNLVPIVVTTASAAVGVISVKVGNAATKYLKIDITKKLNELFNAALERAVQTVISTYFSGDPKQVVVGSSRSIAVDQVVSILQKSMPETLTKLGLDKNKGALVEAVTNALARKAR